MFRIRTLLLTAVLLASLTAAAQMFNPVRWSQKIVMTGDKTGEVVFTATIESGWHMYSNDVDPEIGPTPLSVSYPMLKGVRLNGGLRPSMAPHAEMDDMFEAELKWWTGDVTLRQAFTATDPEFTIAGNITYSACNNQNCIPPTKSSFSLSGKAKITASTADTAEKPAPGAAAATPDAATAPAPEADAATAPAAADTIAESPAPSDATYASLADNPLWTPVKAAGEGESSEGSASLWYIFITCFLGGFVALVTPCVWPIIPMTVSFFMKKGKSGKKGLADAFTYGLSIIVIYVAMGLLITIAFGASALNAMATNAVCNIIFFLLLVVFAISFFGAFEIKLPSSWSNRIDTAAEKTTGLLSIFFMAFTLVLVSFSCTGPIIGTLLVEAVSSGDKLGPAVGMFGFSLALAIPFCFFALFPGMLQKAPKSGSWMNTVKVVLGFIELALSLKFLSVADLAYGWHILDREVFIVLWIAIFALMGLYLLGQYNFAHYGKADSSVGVFRFFLALISLSFAAYLVPGLWGAPLKSVSAFVPPLSTQDFNLYGREFKEYDDYEQGMKAAAEEGKPVLIDFSGYGCVNCRKMEGAVLDNDNVHSLIEDNFVVIKLMVDEKKALPEPITVEEYGKTTILETYGDKWSYLQRHKFNANAQPYYVVLNAQGEMLSGPFSYEENIPAFMEFLEKGMGE